MSLYPVVPVAGDGFAEDGLMIAVRLEDVTMPGHAQPRQQQRRAATTDAVEIYSTCCAVGVSARAGVLSRGPGAGGGARYGEPAGGKRPARGGGAARGWHG